MKVWVLKRRLRRWFINLEKKRGLDTRCSLCEDNMFCEFYCGVDDKNWIHPTRCKDNESTR